MLSYLPQKQAFEHLSKFQCQVYSDFSFSIGNIDFICHKTGVCYAIANLQEGMFRFYKRIKLADFIKIKNYVDAYLNLKPIKNNAASSTLQAKIETVYKCTKGKDKKARYFILNVKTGKYKPISKKRLLSE